MNLQLPLDFERWPEFWQLKNVLRGERAKVLAGRANLAAPEEHEDAMIADMAMLLWMRLWVVLGYLARVTDRPGWLNGMGVQQVNEAFWQFGEDCTPVQLLAQTPLLMPVESAPDEPKGYMCMAFADLNEALAGSYMTKEEKGNRMSEPGRIKNSVAADAKAQILLLPEAVFKKRNGETMASTECEAAMRHIRMIDRLLQPGHRRPLGSFTAGLMADAWAAVESTEIELCQKFYQWLSKRREHPAAPKSAEDILRDWGSIFETAKRMGF